MMPPFLVIKYALTISINNKINTKIYPKLFPLAFHNSETLQHIVSASFQKRGPQESAFSSSHFQGELGQH
jgi:hypothetical protein